MDFRNLSNDEKAELFAKQVNHYFFDVFKMYDYELTVDTNSNEDVRAYTLQHDYTNGANMYTISVSTYWLAECDNSEELIKAAFHEVVEALLGELGAMIIHYSGTSYDKPVINLNAAIHRVVRRLEAVVLPNVELKIDD